ncbi:DUF4275 family protein [Caldalkalibacillus mannanilyticus]|uniref:DUF4275 family protein n=1 Tax=Caldalkalibacillus mannanilyticus TaxID=1418 RepID=UPI0004696E42|nr:DUF4275 family protein [Caldalkalibacillus mannanilyticus]
MNIIYTLRSKKIKTQEIPKWGAYLRKRWEEEFVHHLSADEKKSIMLHDAGGACGYLWHIFSYEKKECLKEKEAQIAFNQERKESCYIFFQHLDFALLVENAALLTAEDLFNESDIYVTDKEFNWTYVNTHERDWCGPYFSRKK